MLKLALPSFLGGPEAPVKTIDPYGPINVDIQTEIASKLTAFDLNFDTIINNSVDMVKKIGAKMSDGGITLSEAKSRIEDALGGSRQGIAYLAEGLEDLILGDMTGRDPGTGQVREANDMIDAVQLIVNGKNALFSGGDYPNISSLTSFISDLTNNPLINSFDLGAEAALAKGILTEVTKWGIPEIIDETLGASWNVDMSRYDYKYDEDFRFSVVKRTSADLTPDVDLVTIKQLMIHGGPSALIAANPNFPELLLEQYSFPLGIVPAADPMRPDLHTYAKELALLEEILTSLRPDWFEQQRVVFNPEADPKYSTDVVWNLRFISKASDNARRLMMSDTKYIAPLLTAPKYTVIAGKQMLKQMYPYIVLQ